MEAFERSTVWQANTRTGLLETELGGECISDLFYRRLLLIKIKLLVILFRV